MLLVLGRIVALTKTYNFVSEALDPEARLFGTGAPIEIVGVCC